MTWSSATVFHRVGAKIGGGEALRGLLHIIASDPAELVRYRAYEAALAAASAAAIVPALEAFPASASYKRDDVIDFLVKDVTKIGAPARPSVQKALASPAVLARMTAVLALEAPLPADARQSLGMPADDNRAPDLIASIHNEPVRAAAATRATDCAWSSHRAYVALARPQPWLHVAEGLHRAGFD